MSKILFSLIFPLHFFSACAQNEIPLMINDGGYIFLTVKINGNQSAKFMLDTGAGITVLSADLFRKYRLEKAGMHTGTRHNGQSITGPVYTLPSLAVGTLIQRNLIVGEYDRLQNCDGLLSMDYFRNTPFTIDFINKKLILESSESVSHISAQAEKIPIRLKTNGKNELDFFVTVCINDSIAAQAEFDTGAGFNMLMLNNSYLQKLHIDIDKMPKRDYGYYVYSTFLPSLAYCGSATLKQKNIFVGFKEGLIYEALIGSGMFRNRKLTINIPRSEMLVAKYQ